MYGPLLAVGIRSDALAKNLVTCITRHARWLVPQQLDGLTKALGSDVRYYRKPKLRVAKENTRAPGVTLTTLTSLLLGSSVLSALITQGFSIYTKQEGKFSTAQYTALRIAATLEAYGDVLQQASEDNSNPKLLAQMDLGDGDHSSKWASSNTLTSIPKLPEYPRDIDLSSLSPEDASMALGFPLVVAATDRRIRGLNPHPEKGVDNGLATKVDDVLDPLMKLCNETAAKLRTKYRVPERWNRKVVGVQYGM